MPGVQSRLTLAVAFGLGLVSLIGTPAAAQRYSNTSPGRPLQIEDAIPVERFGLDMRLAPAAFGRSAGRSGWSVEAGIAYGIVPRLQVDVAAPIGYRDVGQGSSSGVAGVSLSALYAFNIESRSVPAIALRAGTMVPVGEFGPRRMHESLRGIVTRSFPWGRVHFNHQYTFGGEPDLVTSPFRELTASSDVGGSLSRWTTGVAVDRAFPISGLLVGAELFARHSLVDSLAAQWHAGAGIRYQWSSSVSVDVGASTAFTGSTPGWSVRFGVARSTSVQRLIPGLGGWGR